MNIAIMAIIIIYFFGMLALGYIGMRRTVTAGDFFLGGRTIGPWVSAFAYGTTYFSAVLFIGFAGKIGWGFGMDTIWIVIGNTIVGTAIPWLFLAKRTRIMSIQLKAMTMPEFLGARFNSTFLKVASALVIFIFLLPYSASVFMGLSYLFEVNIGIPYTVAVLAMGIATGIYLVMGGYHAVALTDLVQGTIMIGGAILLVVFIIIQAGGVGAIQAEWGARFAENIPNPGGFFGILPIVLLTSLAPLGMPQMVQKFYAIKSEKVIKTALIVSTIFALLISFSAYFTGAMSHMFFKALPGGNPDLLIPTMISEQLPNALSTIILLLVLSASMSTLASLILVSSSSVSIDLIGGVIRPKTGPKTMTIYLRILCAIFIICSMLIAVFQPTFIVSLMSMSWGAVAGSLLAPFIYGLFWKKTTLYGAIAGFLSGLCISLILYITLTPAQGPWAGSIGMIAPLFVVPIVSLLTQPKNRTEIEAVPASE